jgi:hypothetical protein
MDAAFGLLHVGNEQPCGIGSDIYGSKLHFAKLNIALCKPQNILFIC